MTDFKNVLLKLSKNLNTLQKREAKHGGNAPLDLLKQIENRQTAVALTRPAITGELHPASIRIPQ